MFLSDILRGVQISIEAVATVPAPEKRLRATISAGLMPTARTGLAGMARINFDHLASLRLCLVGKKALQLGKAPRVHPALSFTPFVGNSLADIREVLKHDGTARGGVLHEAFGEDVIVIFSLPQQFSRKCFQVPFGRLASL